MDSKRPVEKTFNALKHMVDADMESTNGSLDVLERINHSVTNKYMDLADAARGLDEDGGLLRDANADIYNYVQKVHEIDRESTYLMELVKELDEWSKELEVKCRHYKS